MLFTCSKKSGLVIYCPWFCFQITRRDETIQQLEGDLDTSRKQLKDAIEEVSKIFSDAILSVRTWSPTLRLSEV